MSAKYDYIHVLHSDLKGRSAIDTIIKVRHLLRIAGANAHDVERFERRAIASVDQGLLLAVVSEWITVEEDDA